MKSGIIATIRDIWKVLRGIPVEDRQALFQMFKSIAAQVKAAKDPGSPGGKSITPEERADLAMSIGLDVAQTVQDILQDDQGPE